LSKVVRRISYPVIGYLFLLLGFALLGLFVAALAYGSDLAAVAGLALAGALVTSVVSFRKGALILAQSRTPGDPGHNVSIWSEPFRQDRVDQYYMNFRGELGRAQPATVTAVAPRTSRASHRKPLLDAAARLSA
jgi:hypothetical protein